MLQNLENHQKIMFAVARETCGSSWGCISHHNESSIFMFFIIPVSAAMLQSITQRRFSCSISLALTATAFPSTAFNFSPKATECESRSRENSSFSMESICGCLGKTRRTAPPTRVFAETKSLSRHY